MDNIIEFPGYEDEGEDDPDIAAFIDAVEAHDAGDYENANHLLVAALYHRFRHVLDQSDIDDAIRAFMPHEERERILRRARRER